MNKTMQKHSKYNYTYTKSGLKADSAPVYNQNCGDTIRCVL